LALSSSGAGAVIVDLDVEAVQQEAVQFAHLQLAEVFRQGQRRVHRRAEGVRQVVAQQGQQGVRVGQAGLVEGIQVQLERLRFDDVGRIGRRRDGRDRHLRLAAHVQPRQFVGIPDVDAEEGQGAGQAEFVALLLARDGKQQLRCVFGLVGRSLAERRLIRGIGHGVVSMAGRARDSAGPARQSGVSYTFPAIVARTVYGCVTGGA
jgi:hypothetical protein